MTFSLKRWYKNLDSDQQNVLQATSCSLLLILLLFLICPTPDGFFFSFLVLSWVITYAFSWRNRTKFSKKSFRSKNGKVFTLKDSKQYWIFVFIMIPLTFFMAVVLVLLINPSDDGSFGILVMTLHLMLCSRMYLFYKRIPLRAFTLISGPGGRHNHRRSSPRFSSSSNGAFYSPAPNRSNGYGTMGPYSYSGSSYHRR